MGITKTFCYCISPAKICKAEELAQDMLVDEEHWNEIEKNCLAYLEDPMCVPDTEEADQVPDPVAKGLDRYVSHLRNVRLASAGPAPAPDVYLDMARSCGAIASELEGLGSQIAEGQLPSEHWTHQLSEPATADLGEFDSRIVTLGHVMARAYARASIELQSSVEQGLTSYIAHHFVLMQDIAHEMRALSLGAMRGVSTANPAPDHHREHAAVGA